MVARSLRLWVLALSVARSLRERGLWLVEEVQFAEESAHGVSGPHSTLSRVIFLCGLCALCG